MKTWITNLKPGAKVLLYSRASLPEVKTVQRYAKTLMSFKNKPEVVLILNECQVRFSMDGRGVATYGDGQIWIQKATENNLRRVG